jgi:AcrR family transcriptional regulator
MSVKAERKSLAKHQRGHLSRGLIARTGLAVARLEGVENLTMKRLAQELSVTPMAIYRHFDDKSDLIDAVLDEFVKQNDICNHKIPTTDWANWLSQTFSNMYEGLQSMPSVYPYLSSASRFGPGATEVVETTLTVLQSAGFSLQRASAAVNALNGFVIGCAIMDNAFYENIQSDKSLSEQVANPGIEPGIETGLRLIISALENEHKTISN